MITHLALHALEQGDYSSAIALISGGEAPTSVSNLKPEDSLFSKHWWNDGESYLRWLVRLEQTEGASPRPLYRVVNYWQDTLRLPQYDELRDSTELSLGNRGYNACTRLRENAEAALYALALVKLEEETFLGNISRVLPHIYLTDADRTPTFLNRFTAKGKGIRKFQRAFRKIDDLYQSTESSHVFAYGGFLTLLKHIAEGKPFPQATESDPAPNHSVFTLALTISQEKAAALLAHARKVMNEEEIRYNWPTLGATN